jgi:hypothetical protein
MERVEGKDLAALLRAAREAGTWPPHAVALYVMGEILDGLSYIHDRERFGQKAIVHRDLSPQNVLVSFAGEVKISDFGISRPVTASVTGDVIRGKLKYMSPEILHGHPATYQSDQFAAGAVFYELISGRPLFGGANDAEILDRVRACQVPPLEAGDQSLPHGLEDVVRRMLATRPEDRFPTTSAAGKALAALGYRPGGSAALSDLMLRLFSLPPVSATLTGRQRINLPSQPGDTLPDEKRPIDGSWLRDPSPPEFLPITGTAAMPDPDLPSTRTIRTEVPRRRGTFRRDPEFPASRMASLYESAEKAHKEAVQSGAFAATFDDWLQHHASRGTDAISGRRLPADWNRVATWPRFTDAGWAHPLQFGWNGSAPWGADGFWIAEDSLADEMMVVFAKDLGRDEFATTTPETWAKWWRDREVDVDHELPGGRRVPMSRRAREILGESESPPLTKKAWQMLVFDHESVTSVRAVVPGQKTSRPSFWQKLFRLSRASAEATGERDVRRASK